MIEPGSREEKNALSFLSLLHGEAGFAMREPGYLTLQNIELLGLSFGKATGDEPVDPLKKRDDVNAYLFIQSAPGRDVSRAVRAYRAALATKGRDEAFVDFMCDFVEPFLMSLPTTMKADLAEQLGQIDEIEAAKVDAVRPRGQKTGRPDPNCSSQAGSPQG